MKISELIPDDKNYNQGNEFGNSLIEKSLRKNGAGRSILIDKNNRIIAGNKTVENAASIGLEDLLIVESDGTKIIAVKRTDIDLDSKAGREMALADNATSKANIVWNHENLKDDWGDEELKGWGVEPEATEGLSGEYSEKLGEVLYEPKKSNHEPLDLFVKETKFDDEINQIKNSQIREMLLARACFFSQFNYAKIADYYAYQATPEEKAIFEKLALVLLDKEQLIENGFSDLMNELDGNEYE